MKLKKLIILLVILGALIALVLVKKAAVRSRAVPFEKAQEAMFITLTPQVSEGFISKIVIYKGSDQARKVTLLKKAAGDWTVESGFTARARKAIPEGLIKDLSALKGELRAGSKDVFADFQISDEEGVHIVLVNMAGGESVHVVTGLKMPSWNKSFVRVSGAQDVCLADKNFLLTLGLYDPKAALAIQSFVDLKVFARDIASADRVEIKPAAGAPVVLKKAEAGTAPGWQFDPVDPKGKIDPAKVEEFIRLLSNLHAQEAVDPQGTSYGLDKPSFSAAVSVTEKGAPVTYTLEIGNPDPDRKAFYVRILPENIVFRVPESVIQGLKKDRTFFLEGPAPKK